MGHMRAPRSDGRARLSAFLSEARGIASYYPVEILVEPCAAPGVAHLVWLARTGGVPGDGARALGRLTDLADEAGIPLVLTALDSEPSLVRLYGNAGFEPTAVTDGGTAMARRPHAFPSMSPGAMAPRGGASAARRP